jgi:hypothetical protein
MSSGQSQCQTEKGNKAFFTKINLFRGMELHSASIIPHLKQHLRTIT